MKLLRLLLLVFICTSVNNVFGQVKFIPLQHETKTVSFTFGGSGMTNDGSVLTAIRNQDQLSDVLTLDTLRLYSIDFITAGIDIQLSKKDTSEMGIENSYFISVGFFNNDKEFVFGHNFCSDYGFSLAGVRSDLSNVTEMYLIDNGNGHFTLKATDQLAIHQTYLYEGEIKFIVLNITHLGAG